MTTRQIGRWALTRSIVDRDIGGEIRCTGFAELRPRDGAIVYEEAVSFRLGGKLIRATRAYRFHSSGGAVVATFSDGSPFFSLRLDAKGGGAAIHHCGEDLYTLALSLDGPDTWRTQWDVGGTKQSRIVTRYTRLSRS